MASKKMMGLVHARRCEISNKANFYETILIKISIILGCDKESAKMGQGGSKRWYKQ